MADEPVSRIRRAVLKTRKLLILSSVEQSMESALAATEGFLSHFLSQFCGGRGEWI
jgi:hypothetical protein